MRRHWAWLPLLLWGLLAGGAPAQQPGSAVQLPTFSHFSVGTTVSVPDRGSVYMGGIKRASSGRNEFGTPMLGKIPFLGRPFKNVGIGSERSASNVHVSVYIHDFEAMDEYLLSQPTSYASGRLPRSRLAAMGHTLQPRNPAYGASWRTSLSAAGGSPPQMSVAEATARRASHKVSRSQEAEDFFRRGNKAEAAGKSGVAKIYYQMAARRAAGELKDRALARLEVVGGATAAPKIAQARP